MTYGVERWFIKKQHMHKISAIEMRMSRDVWSTNLKDIIRNENFHEHLGVAPICDKIKRDSFEMVWSLNMSNIGQQRRR